MCDLQEVTLSLLAEEPLLGKYILSFLLSLSVSQIMAHAISSGDTNLPTGRSSWSPAKAIQKS